MIYHKSVAPPNSLLLVMDQAVGKVPDSMNQRSLSSTTSCIAIGTLAEADGEVFVSLSDECPPQLQHQSLVFDNTILTTSKRISVCSVLDDVLLTIGVPESITRVRIWVNHGCEPNEVIVVVGECESQL